MCAYVGATPLALVCVQVQIRARIVQSILGLLAGRAYIWAEFRLVFNASVKASTVDCRLSSVCGVHLAEESKETQRTQFVIVCKSGHKSCVQRKGGKVEMHTKDANENCFPLVSLSVLRHCLVAISLRYCATHCIATQILRQCGQKGTADCCGCSTRSRACHNELQMQCLNATLLQSKHFIIPSTVRGKGYSKI